MEFFSQEAQPEDRDLLKALGKVIEFDLRVAIANGLLPRA
jgi:hypothetical protein